MNTDIFGNPITPVQPKPSREKTKKPQPSKPKPSPVKESITTAPTQVIEEETGDLNAKYDLGDRVEYKYPKSAGGHWEEGIFLGFYDPAYPSNTAQTERYSFIEVEIRGVIRKAYGLHQIRKVQ